MQPNFTLLKFASWRFFLLAGIVLVISGQVMPVPLASAPETTVSMKTEQDTLAEGKSTIIRITRSGREGNLAVTLAFSGEAVLDKDYALKGVERVTSNQAVATIPDGQSFIELTLKARHDVPAEAEQAIVLTLKAEAGYTVDSKANKAVLKIPANDFMVTTTADAGEGSLRQAILNSNALEGPDTITFDSKVGPFVTPQTITLASELPELLGEVTIDGYIKGRLWKPSGVTVRGGNQRRIFSVSAGAKVTLKYFTIAEGLSENGGGIVNRGNLIVKSVTFVGNTAEHNGGGIANLGGNLTVINSTFVDNRAGNAGGGMADIEGKATVTNCTFSGNSAKSGGGLFSNGELLVRNTILANSEGGSDCVAAGTFDPAGTHNLIESNEGCGEPISTADPRLAKMGFYNGPSRTIPLRGGSPAINLGDNASAVDENGRALKWDQRGNGDPRFVAGITDIGAFEYQAFPTLSVDTFEDTELRACTSGAADCSLRGAITLANATEKVSVITFDPKVFDVPRTIVLTKPMPDLKSDMTIDAGKTAGVTVRGTGKFKVFNFIPDARVKLINIKEK